MDLPDSPPSLWSAPPGMWEPRLLLMDPARLVREEKRRAISLGAGVYENTPVLAVAKLPGPGGGLTQRGYLQAEDAFHERLPARTRRGPAPGTGRAIPARVRR